MDTHTNKKDFPSPQVNTREHTTHTTDRQDSNNTVVVLHNTGHTREEPDNFENTEYASVDVESREPSYSVVGRKVGGRREGGYDTLVRSSEHDNKLEFSTNSLNREGSYSTLLSSLELN